MFEIFRCHIFIGPLDSQNEKCGKFPEFRILLRKNLLMPVNWMSFLCSCTCTYCRPLSQVSMHHLLPLKPLLTDLTSFVSSSSSSNVKYGWRQSLYTHIIMTNINKRQHPYLLPTVHSIFAVEKLFYQSLFITFHCHVTLFSLGFNLFLF